MSREHYWNHEERERQRAGLSYVAPTLQRHVRAVCSLSEEIDRLDDLRRWRSMTETEGAERVNCVLLDRSSTVDVCRTRIGTRALGKWRIVDEGDIPERDLAEWRWAYIPGQEPEVSHG
jgi:hypothetical protein